MTKLLNKCKNYLGDDSALADDVSLIIKIVFGVLIAMGLGYFGYNMIADKANTATELGNQSNPGAGNEFSNTNPFGGSSSSGGN